MTHMVRYTVKRDLVGHNEDLLRGVFADLERVRPAGLRYAAVKLEDGVSFVHVISRAPGAAPAPGRELAALRAFHADLRDRCTDPPVRTALSVIGIYGADA